MKLNALPDSCEPECSIDVVRARMSGRQLEAAQLAKVTGLFFALSDPSRLRILLAMKTGHELCVCDIAGLLGVSVSAASHHLRKMKDLGILSNRSDGKLVYYSLADKRVVKALDAVMD